MIETIIKKFVESIRRLLDNSRARSPIFFNFMDNERQKNSLYHKFPTITALVNFYIFISVIIINITIIINFINDTSISVNKIITNFLIRTSTTIYHNLCQGQYQHYHNCNHFNYLVTAQNVYIRVSKGFQCSFNSFPFNQKVT